jgi:thiol-disulfide isomerase/thioredoxin
VPATLKFTGTTLDGKPFDAAMLTGGPVILWFWAPWCTTCFGQASSVNEMAARYGRRVTLLGVAGLDQSVPAMQRFVAEGETGNIQHLDDRTGMLWKRFGIAEQSTFVLINRAGTVMATSYLDSATLEDWAAYLDQH